MRPYFCRTAAGCTVFTLALLLSGCGGGGSGTLASAGRSAAEEEMDPAEKPYYDAGKPFYAAIAQQDYAKAYEMLSSHAKARMSMNQFRAPKDDAEQHKGEVEAKSNVSAAQFADLIGSTVAKEFGQPSKLGHLSVFSIDKAVLTRTSKEELGALDSMFAIGMMPDSIPKDIRKASLRGQIITTLNDAELAKAAKDYETTVEELKANEDFQPGFNLKIVLVEEDGALKVGYFEFMPPSMFD